MSNHLDPDQVGCFKQAWSGSQHYAEVIKEDKGVRALTLLLPNATIVEFTLHFQTRLQSKFKGTVDSYLFLTVIRDTKLCSLFQNIQGT